MKKIFTITNDMFCQDIVVAVGLSGEEAREWVSENTSLKMTDALCDALNFSNTERARTIFEKPFMMLWFKEWSGSFRDVGYLSHEAFHIAEFALDDRGVIYDLEKSGEVFAYFIQNVVEQVLEGVGE